MSRALGLEDHAAEIAAVQVWATFSALGFAQPSHREHRWREVQMRADGIRLDAVRPVRMGDDQRDVHGLPVDDAPLLAQPVRTSHLTVIRGVDNDRVLGLTRRLERIQHRPKMPIDVADAVDVVVDVPQPQVGAILRDLTVGDVAEMSVRLDALGLSREIRTPSRGSSQSIS